MIYHTVVLVELIEEMDNAFLTVKFLTRVVRSDKVYAGYRLASINYKVHATMTLKDIPIEEGIKVCL